MKRFMDFTVMNNINSVIKNEKERRIKSNEPKFLEKEIMNELAVYTDVSINQIIRIKHNYSQPSLGVAILIAEFFNMHVEDLFKVVARNNAENEHD